jgi:hypothetical protein
MNDRRPLRATVQNATFDRHSDVTAISCVPTPFDTLDSCNIDFVKHDTKEPFMNEGGDTESHIEIIDACLSPFSDQSKSIE